MTIKAIVITEDNQSQLIGKFPTLLDVEQIPIGHVLIAPFGTDEEFNVLTKDQFETFYVVVRQLKNDFVEAVAIS